DVLLIAPAAMGLIFALGRIWDAISAPVAGYYSDRSTAQRGRRRAWMYVSAVPVFITTVLLWSPPPAAEGVLLMLWMAAALLLYETAATIFFVPYGALGMELTQRYHERTRLFGYRHIIGAVGAGVGLGFVYLLRTAEEPRFSAFLISLIGGAAMAAMILFAAIKLPEREDYKGRGAVHIGKAFMDVLRNPHGRLLFIVYGVETFGGASVAMLAPFIMQYVVNAPQYTEVFVLMYFVPQLAFTPMWIWLGKRISKKSLWLFSMTCMTAGYFAVFWVGQESYTLLFVVIALLGLGGGCGAIVAPSIQADVIDYDEYMTGERKEGAYIAVWNLIRKGSAGVTAALTGVTLQWVGYQANVEQTEATKVAMLALMSILPGGCYLIGTLLFTRFGLNEREHDEVMVELRRRRGGEIGPQKSQ
ncbi:MAG: MFS transporter, partial [Deltaproteobacteria bacterium]|nr:MFS transporter [Deltaproteobacteria bacterium]